MLKHIIKLHYSQFCGYLYFYVGISTQTLASLGMEQEMISRYEQLRLYKALTLANLMSTFRNIPRTNNNFEMFGNVLSPQQDESEKEYIIRVLETAQAKIIFSETGSGMIEQQFNKKIKKIPRKNCLLMLFFILKLLSLFIVSVFLIRAYYIGLF